MLDHKFDEAKTLATGTVGHQTLVSTSTVKDMKGIVMRPENTSLRTRKGEPRGKIGGEGTEKPGPAENTPMPNRSGTQTPKETKPKKEKTQIRKTNWAPNDPTPTHLGRLLVDSHSGGLFCGKTVYPDPPDRIFVPSRCTQPGSQRG